MKHAPMPTVLLCIGGAAGWPGHTGLARPYGARTRVAAVGGDGVKASSGGAGGGHRGCCVRPRWVHTLRVSAGRQGVGEAWASTCCTYPHPALDLPRRLLLPDPCLGRSAMALASALVGGGAWMAISCRRPKLLTCTTSCSSSACSYAAASCSCRHGQPGHTWSSMHQHQRQQQQQLASSWAAGGGPRHLRPPTRQPRRRG